MLISEHPLVIHEDVFFYRFRPYRHPKAAHKIWGDLGLETFGDDMELVRALDINSIWTVLDANDSDMTIIAPGIHYVNRVAYLVTRHPHYFSDIEVEVENRASVANARTLASQLQKVNSLIRRERRKR